MWSNWGSPQGNTLFPILQLSGFENLNHGPAERVGQEASIQTGLRDA